MIKRIVKLTFQEDKLDSFQTIFEESRQKIRQFPGCHHLELWASKNPGNIFFTYSLWESEDALENYRKSELFTETWSRTKVLFADKPEAWSTEAIIIC